MCIPLYFKKVLKLGEKLDQYALFSRIDIYQIDMRYIYIYIHKLRTHSYIVYIFINVGSCLKTGQRSIFFYNENQK